MFESSLSKLAARKGWKNDESFLFRGELNGCPVTIVDGEGFIEVILSMPGFCEESPQWSAIRKTIDAYSGLRILHSCVVDGFLSIRIHRNRFSHFASVDSVELFLTILMDQAAELGLITPHVCAVCHEPAEELSTLYDLAAYVHPECRVEAGDTLPSYPLYLRYEESGKDPYRFLKAK